MKVTRTSGLPIDRVEEYKNELDEGMQRITKELGRFESLNQKKQGEFVRRFDEMKKEVMSRYEFEADWDFDSVLKSKSKLKELCNQFGAIAFARSADGKALECFIIDSKF